MEGKKQAFLNENVDFMYNYKEKVYASRRKISDLYKNKPVGSQKPRPNQVDSHSLEKK